MKHGMAFFNGQWVEYKDLMIHASDLSIQRGYGIFDYLRERQGELKYLDSHIQRFLNSKDLAKLKCDYTHAELESILKELIAKNGFGNSGIKFILTGGYSLDGFSPPDQTNFMVINTSGKITYAPGGHTLVLDHYLRPNSTIKTIQYFNSALVYDKIQKYNAVDVLYHYEGRVSECSRCNFFIVKDGVIATAVDNVLYGITRKRLLEKCMGKFQFDLRPIRTEEIFTSDELFITSTTKDVLPITKVEDHIIGNGQVGTITTSLMEYFNDL